MIDLAACYQSTMFGQAPLGDPQNSRRLWHNFLARLRPTVSFLLLSIFCSAFPLTTYGAEGSYRNAVKVVWKVYQAASSSPYYQVAEKLNECYERFEKGQDGFIAAVNGQPLPAFGGGKFDDDLAELEEKVDTITMPDLQSIPAFPIGILGLSRDVLRQEIRAGVGFIFVALSASAIGSGFIDERQAEQDSINSFSAAIREYGNSLDPLLALGFLPGAQEIAFNVLDLQTHYPQNLSRIANKVDDKKRKAKDLVTAYNRDARNTIDYLLAALDAEDKLLQHDRKEFAAKIQEEERLADLLAESIGLYSQAAETSRRSDEKLQEGYDEVDNLDKNISYDEEKVRNLSAEVTQKLQQAHKDYSFCPLQNTWDTCEHESLKLQWMASANAAPLAYRRAQNDFDQTRARLSQMRQERDNWHRQLPSLEKKAADDEHKMKDAKQVWSRAATEKNEYSEKFNAWKMDTKIELYSSENEKDRKNLVQARMELN